MNPMTRRDFFRQAGMSAAAVPFLFGLPETTWAAPGGKKQRLVFMFSPNGTIPGEFWPDAQGADFKLKRILAPLNDYRDRMLLLRGVCNKVQGDGDNHMRGMSCLLTGKELFPGNIQGGSHTPAGWCKGISIDQEIKNYFQSKPETRTRFGSLEFGAGVLDRADPWTRMSYAGPNKPIAPVDDPYMMFQKLYGSTQDREQLLSVLDDVHEDLKRAKAKLGTRARTLLEDHADFVRDMEKELQAAQGQVLTAPPPELEPDLADMNDNLPKVCRMQIDMLVNSFANDMARVATLQFTKSVGQARMNWLGVKEGHHSLSHDPDKKAESQEKLVKINTWFAEQLLYLAKKLDETPEPGAAGTMLDHTTIVWANELGKGNSHTLNDIPFCLVGGGLGFKTGRSLKYENIPHNRLLMALAHGVGHKVETFGNPQLSQGGALSLG